MKTQTIAGHEIELESGKRYYASRPMATRDREIFPITVWGWIEDMGTYAVKKIDGLTYDEANEVLAEFNNGPTSFDGRVW